MSNANLSNANFGIDERHPPIKARRVSFTWDDTPLHWIPRDPVATHIINAFHILLPAGERWFIQCVNDALPEITDERLRQEVKGFIGQEMVHARSHQGVLDRLLEKNGIDTRKITDQMNQGIDERPQRKAKLSPRRSRRILMFELAAVAAIEHYTATFGQWLIENDALDKAGADPTMLDMLRWHSAEEVEHRSVVFDVYQHLGGRYATRAAGWAVALFFLYWAMIDGTLHLMRHDPTIVRKVTALRVYRSYRKSIRRGHIPSIFGMILGQAPVYLRPSHHPSQTHDTQKALDYLMGSPAAQAAGYHPY
jgi:predicted metal-dependent hydrolase